MDKFCGNCTYLDVSSGNCYGKFYCSKKWERHLATDNACSSYTKAYSRDRNTVKNAVDFSNSHTSSNCYITTLLCDLLGLNDSNYYINTLRKFRNNYLRNNEDYSYLLVEYDLVGKEICNSLISDKQNRLIASKLFYNYINPIVSLIDDKMYADAIVRYIMMVNKLKNMYNINTTVTKEEYDAANINFSGHGKYIKKVVYLD